MGTARHPPSRFGRFSERFQMKAEEIEPEAAPLVPIRRWSQAALTTALRLPTRGCARKRDDVRAYLMVGKLVRW
jgi:hypothetical protein